MNKSAFIVCLFLLAVVANAQLGELLGAPIADNYGYVNYSIS
jgi:hypothetical protein